MNVEPQHGAGVFRRKWIILSAVMLGSFMGPLDGSIVNTVLPDISSYFHTTVSIAQWVPTVYLLTISCLILLFGRLGDMVGCRRIYLLGLGSFAAASLLCGFSQSVWMLIVFRAVQGLAAGMMMSVGYAIITAAFPPQERGRAMGTYAIAIAVALGLGPTLGGAIAEYLSWHYVFFINVPIGIIALAWGLRVIPKTQAKAGQRLDWQGALAAFVFLTCLLLCANQGQSWGWGSPSIIALLAVALLGAVAFFVIEKRASQPMLDLTLFKSRVFSFAVLSSMLNFVALYCVVFITPFYMDMVLHYSILKIGIVLVASPIATLFVAPFSGRLSDSVGSRWLAVSGMIVMAVGLFLMSQLNASSSVADIMWRLALCGVGGGLFQSPNNSAAMGSVSRERLGISSGVLVAMRNVGMVLGIALSGVVLYNLAPVAASGQVHGLSGAEVGQFLHGLKWSYVAGSIVAGVAVLTSLAARKPAAEMPTQK
jgi:EmrB/QacA subfamily drug resistance transporter